MPVRVLLIDDDAAFRRAASGLLAAHGYEIAGEADSLAAGRRAIRRLRPDAVLLDVNLPDGNGVTFAAELSRDGTSPRVLLTSSDAAAVTTRLLERCGATGFLLKTELASADLRGRLG